MSDSGSRASAASGAQASSATSGKAKPRRWMGFVRATLLGIASLILIALVTHGSIQALCRMAPPQVPDLTVALGPVERTEGRARVGASFTRVRAGIREVHLKGDGATIGASHGALLRPAMIGNETELWGELDRVVPFGPARALLLDIGRVRYRHVDRAMPVHRREEIAAEARAIAPDPFEGRIPTYDRMILLHALYDIALSFEHSPLVGCSTFVLGPEATTNRHTLLARAFDFEAGEVFDRDKAVFFVERPGTIPFASVSWPGLVGVVSGMNAEGLALVVHGGRAGEPRTEGLPVVFSTRETLERARNVDEAVAVLSEQSVMVSHVVALADAKGEAAVVERAPGVPAFVRRTFADPNRIAVTNHFEGPLASDPKNVSVEAHTTTRARRARLDELLGSVGPNQADVRRAVAMLRDHECANGARCSLGDRRAIDAFIATHGIVADTTSKTLWVSAGPQLSGRFVAFDLAYAFADRGDGERSEPGAEAIVDADPALADGRYREARARAVRTRGLDEARHGAP